MKKGDSFTVEMDGVALSRPILFENTSKPKEHSHKPFLCVGNVNTIFKGRSTSMTGGPLQFEAYLYWAPKIVPIQHQGVAVRVGNASGALFERTFMGYQVSEQTRLRQITVEIFVQQGFDGAINIDRESFNYGHPHYQYILKWLHSALRQFTNRNKEIGKGQRAKKLKARGEKTLRTIDKTVAKIREARQTEEEPEIEIVINVPVEDVKEKRSDGVIVFNRDAIFPTSNAVRNSQKKIQDDQVADSRARALASVLDAYDLLKPLSFVDQEALIRDIFAIFVSGDDE